MAKKNRNNDKKNFMIAGGVILAAIVIYLVSSYAGLLGTQTYTGSDGKVATKLTCAVNSDNTVSAILSVANAGSNSLSLPTGSVLKGEKITWSIPSSAGTVSPESSITDDQGMTKTKVTANSSSSVTASFDGDTYTLGSNVVDGSVTYSTVTYDSSVCEVPVSGK